MSCDKLSKENNPTSPFQNAHLQSTDDILATINDQIPDYGGSYIDESGQLNILVTGKTQKSAQAQEALKTEITNALMEVEHKFGGSTENLAKTGRATLKEAQYSFKQLNDWRTQIRYELMGNGVNSISIDEKANKVVVECQKETCDILRSRENSSYLLLINTESIVTPKNFETTENVSKVQSCQYLTIRDDMRVCDDGRFVPGVHVGLGASNCTIGLNIKYGLTKGFITASHCGVGGLFLNQNRIATHKLYDPGDRVILGGDIGREYKDPESLVNTKCTRNQVALPCRYSDAAMFLYDQSNSIQSKVAVGKIPSIRSRFYIQDNKMEGLSIVGSDNSLSLNNATNTINVSSIGIATGYQNGHQLIETCEDRLMDNYVLLCQMRYETGRLLQGGDSGGPVYSEGINDEVNFIGIQVGTFLYNSKNYIIVSPMRYILGGVPRRVALDCGAGELCSSGINFEFRSNCAKHNYLDYQECKPITPVTGTGTGTDPRTEEEIRRQQALSTYIRESQANVNYTRRIFAFTPEGALRLQTGYPIGVVPAMTSVEAYMAKCVALGMTSSQIVDCWDKRFIPIVETNLRVRFLLKANTYNPNNINNFHISLTKGTSIASEASYIYKNIFDYGIPIYKVLPSLRVMLYADNFPNYPILIDKQALDLLETAYYAPKPPTPICKDIINCNPPKPPVIREDAKL